MLVPQSQGGTPALIHDAREIPPSTTLVESAADVPSTFTASSGAVRRLVLVNNSQEDRSTVPVMDLTMLDTDSDASYNSAHNPQEALGDAEEYSLSDTATVG